ncbi:MAG: DUF6077 domain-containing protein [Thermoflexaceae bacterium]|nr:DUF6077 domain-containing protein [Thermoflexaceae bacterium]
MIVIKGFMVVIALIGVPIILGNLITAHMEDEYRGHFLADWVFGIALMFCELQIMAVPMIIADYPFHTLFYVYVSVIALEVIFALSRYSQIILDRIKEFPLRIRKTDVLGILVVLSILMQGFMLFYFEHTDDDDARFVPSAVAAVEKDMMFEENPVTGELLYGGLSEVYKDMISPWIMFWAIVSKMSAVHPAILMHSIVPLIFIPLAYAVYWLIAGYFFGKDSEKKLIFLGLVSAIHIFSGYSVYNSGAFLLFRIWQGKAMFTSIFAPLLILLALRLFQDDRKTGAADYVTIAVTCCGACMTSGFGIILSAMFFALISVIYAILKRDVKGLVLLWISMIPCLVYGFLYAFGSKLFIS